MLLTILKYLRNLFILVDEALNTLRGGDPGETISEAAGKAQTQGKAWACILCKLLNFIQKDHCAKAVAAKGTRSLWSD